MDITQRCDSPPPSFSGIIDEQSVAHGAADRAASQWRVYLPRPGQRGRSALAVKVAWSMQSITNVQVKSFLDLDHGEGRVSFSWSDANGIARSLTIDADGHCSREMPIRSGVGVTITSVLRDRVKLQFTEALAAKLDLDQEVEFEGIVQENAYADLSQLAKYF